MDIKKEISSKTPAYFNNEQLLEICGQEMLSKMKKKQFIAERKKQRAKLFQ